MSTTSRLALLLVAVLSVSTAFAHEYWIDREGRQFVLNQGHKTAAHGGAAAVSYDTTTITSVQCSEESGKNRPLPVKGNPARVEGDCAAVSFQLNSGYWTKTPYDTFNKPRNEVKGALQSWLSEETVTRIERWSPVLAKPNANGLQLSLASDPDRLKSGDKFTLVATLNGAPQANVAVAYDGETRGTTDNEGRINLRVRHNGLQLIAASLETPLADGKADTLIRGATLNFVLP
jgi:nickel transport protein